MKKKYSCLLFFFLLAFVGLNYVLAQNPGEWMWINGSQTANDPGSHGTKGVTAATNQPPALYEANEWTDLNGNFWLFGGSLGGTTTFPNDLWKYDPAINQWTWMTGTNASADPGTYGTMGMPSPTNSPPSQRAGATWTDLNGNLWMLGGNGGGKIYGALWKYDISTNEWTWMKGTQASNAAGVYGTKQVPNVANYPGGRCEFATAWTDNAGDLWLFGGYGNGSGLINDLWRYNIATNTWTWMKGSNTNFQPSVYGTKAVEASANTPGGRSCYSRWKDNNGNLWLFGAWDNGYGYFNHTLNDLWRFNPSTNNWAWMSGDTIGGALNIHGTKCLTTPTNKPDARYENRATWTDACGNLWMFGGNGAPYFGPMENDLWMYCITKNEWTWVSGDASGGSGNWGTINVSSPANKPAPGMGSIGWNDHKGHLYLFGGNPAYNNVWKYTIDPTCGSCACTVTLPVPLFTSSDTTFCNEGGACIDFFDHSTGNPTSWKWSFQGATPDTSTIQNPTSICYYIPGTYAVTLVVSNAGGTDSLVVNSHIIFGSGAALPIITRKGDTLFCSHEAAYQWYYNGSPISGATDSFYVALQDGPYAVYITDDIGCSRLSNVFTFVLVNELTGKSEFVLYPNPVFGEMTISFSSPLKENTELFISDALGKEIARTAIEKSKTIYRINMDDYSNGIYLLQLRSGAQIVNKKFVVMHK